MDSFFRVGSSCFCCWIKILSFYLLGLKWIAFLLDYWWLCWITRWIVFVWTKHLVKLGSGCWIGLDLGGFLERVGTDPITESREGCDCLAGLECLLSIIRALRMGSCLSTESRSPLPSSPTSSVGRKRKGSLKRRPGSRNSSFDYKREEMLHRIPGRLFLNGSSEVASLFTQQGKKGTNQDAMIVWEVCFIFTLSSYSFGWSQKNWMLDCWASVWWSFMIIKSLMLSVYRYRTTTKLILVLIWIN